MSLPKNKTLLPYAKHLRRKLTPQESKLWFQFLRTYPVKIYRQRIIGPYIVDFYCHSAKLVIELDGLPHYTEQSIEYDSRRTAYLESYGLTVLRIPNYEIDTNFITSCNEIARTIHIRTHNQIQHKSI